MTQEYRMKEPFVLRGKTGPGVFWTISIDESGNHGHPIDREYDLPAFRTNGQTHTDQHAMRRGVIMTAAKHHRILKKRHAGAVEIAAIGDGNLTANFGFVAWWNGSLYYLAGEDVYRNQYTCVVSWKDGRTSIEQIWFAKEFGDVRVERKQSGGVEDITAEIDFVTSGQPLVSQGQRVPLGQIAEKFYDTRHLINPIRIELNKTALFLPNAQLQHGLLRKALDGPVRVTLQAQVDAATVVPLSIKGWLKLAETHPATLDPVAGFLRQHGLLAANESLLEPAILMRVGEKTEQLLAQGLEASGYHVVEELGPLKEGDVCFVNGHMEVYFRNAIYPHNIFVRWPDSSCGAVVFPGKSGREGTTLPDAQRYLTEILGVEDAVLLDNGGDVRLTYRGSELVRSSEKRPQIRAMLALMSAPGSPLGVVQVR